MPAGGFVFFLGLVTVAYRIGSIYSVPKRFINLIATSGSMCCFLNFVTGPGVMSVYSKAWYSLEV